MHIYIRIRGDATGSFSIFHIYTRIIGSRVCVWRKGTVWLDFLTARQWEICTAKRITDVFPRAADAAGQLNARRATWPAIPVARAAIIGGNIKDRRDKRHTRIYIEKKRTGKQSLDSLEWQKRRRPTCEYNPLLMLMSLYSLRPLKARTFKRAYIGARMKKERPQITLIFLRFYIYVLYTGADSIRPPSTCCSSIISFYTLLRALAQSLTTLFFPPIARVRVPSRERVVFLLYIYIYIDRAIMDIIIYACARYTLIVSFLFRKLSYARISSVLGKSSRFVMPDVQSAIGARAVTYKLLGYLYLLNIVNSRQKWWKSVLSKGKHTQRRI